MRTLAVIISVLLAVWLFQQQMLYRSATHDALIGAYRSAALNRCADQSQSLRVKTAATTWATPQTVKLVIGDPDLDVYLWQVNHAMWPARYQHPHLVIVVGDAPRFVMCQYDILNDAAVVRTL